MLATELNWEFIKAQLPEEWHQLAIDMGLIRKHPPHMGTKIDDIEPVLRLELMRVGLETSLQTTTSTTAAAKAAVEASTTEPCASLVDLSPPALHGWERKLGPYFAALLARMTNANAQFVAPLWGGYEIILTDGTTVMRPGAQGTTARILYAMRLADMTLMEQFETDEHGTESLRAFTMHEGQLWLADRNFSNPQDVAHVVQAHAALIVRLNRGMLWLYDDAQQRFDVMDHVRSLQEPEAMAEWSVWVHPTGHPLMQGRLCAVRLPDEEAEEGRRRLRREYDGKVSEEMLEAAAWVMVFTTVPRERLTMPQVLGLYRLRWQMELEIKRDKSIGGMDKLPNRRPDTIATWLYGKLLLQQIARKIISPSVAFPPSGVGAPPSCDDETRRTLRRLVPRIVTEVWRVTVLLYRALHAALFPIPPQDLPAVLDTFLEHIRRRNEKRRPKQIARFLQEVGALEEVGAEVDTAPDG
jgi:hypothetical protein